MLQIISLLLLLTFDLLSFTLKSTYYIHSHNIKLQDIAPSAAYNLTLYKINNNKHSKRIKSREIISLLKAHGMTDVKSTSNYVHFIKKSPIDTSHIKTSIRDFYKEKYPNILIKSILVMPRGYTKSLPENYKVQMQKKAYLSNKGILSIKTLENKKVFFDYVLDASLYVYVSRDSIPRSQKISALNCTKKSVQFTKFRAMPIDKTHLNTSQSKRNLKPDTIITSRDIQVLNMVKRNANVQVRFEDKNINISFSAKALQNGKLNDIITVQKRNKKRLRVKVIGKNRVEIQ